jgi:hypothetical protein
MSSLMEQLQMCWSQCLQGQLRGTRADPDAHDRDNDRRQASQGCVFEGLAMSLLMHVSCHEASQVAAGQACL